MKNQIYLDNAASTPIFDEVAECVFELSKHTFANASSIHTSGRKAKAEIENARRKIASLIHCEPGEIYFTSGGTESNNLVINNAFNLGCDAIVTSEIEHLAVLNSAKKMAKKVPVFYVKLLPNGLVDLQNLTQILSNTSHALVSIMHVNNEIGTIQDCLKISEICKLNNALFHTDSTQSVGLYPIDCKNMGMDFLVGSAHKFNGPKGIGFLFKRNGVVLKPMQIGGSQEKELRSGTENVPAIVGMALALEKSYAQNKVAFLNELKTAFWEIIKDIKGVELNGNLNTDAVHILNVKFPTTPMDSMLLFKLDMEGVFCSGGSACSSGAAKGSHVIDYLYPNHVGVCMRFSFGLLNTISEVKTAANLVKQIVEEACIKL